MANQVLYGYLQQKDLLAAQVTDANVPVFNQAIDAYLADSNVQLNAMMSLFTEQTTNFKERYNAMAISRSQPVDENGKALPIKAGGYADVAYPIHGSGSAWGANYVTRAKMTGNDVSRIIATITDGDRRWMRDHILAALYYGTSGGTGWTYNDPIHGALTVQGLANGDTQAYNVSGGDNATDTHILGQADAIADATNPYDDIYQEIMEHPENGGDVMAFIPSDLKATTMALTAFKDVVDENVRSGANSDVLVGTLGITHPGKLIGYVNHVWIVEWSQLPAGYIVAVATQGVRPLAMREEPEAVLQGFNRVTDGTDPANYPFYESQYLRRAGFGARNRVGAVVYRIGNATYAAPSGYGSPMP